MKDTLPPSDPNDRFPGYKRVDIPSLDTEKAALSERVIGQDEAVSAFASLFVKIKSGVRSVRPSPIDAKFLAGPSGVGKTELVYALAELLAEDDPEARKKVLKINGGEYQQSQRHGISRLFGVPPGFRGSEDQSQPGSGSKVIFSQDNLDAHRIPYIDRDGKQKSVILILVDEADKADHSLHMAFLSILDKGEADLANNRKADFRDAVIFYTSNVGNDKVDQQFQERATKTDVPPAFQEAVEDVVFRAEEREVIIKEFAQAFPPEFRGRIQDTIVFNHLSHEVVGKIAEIKVKDVEAAFATGGIKIELDLPGDVRDWLTKNGYNRSEGARGMDKLVKAKIMDQLVAFEATREVEVLSEGIHRKRIGLGVNQDKTGLEFYFGTGYQLPDPSPKGVAAPSVNPALISPEEFTVSGVLKDDITQVNPGGIISLPETRRFYSGDLLVEQVKWQQVLGVQVEIKPLPANITPDVIGNLRDLGMGLRYIPDLELGDVASIKPDTKDYEFALEKPSPVSIYLHQLEKKYPGWTPSRNLSHEFWNEVREGRIDPPNLPGQWIAVETSAPIYKYKEQQQQNTGEHHPLLEFLGLKSRFNNTPDDIESAIRARGLMKKIGLDETYKLRLLEAIEWNLLANREGWDVTTSNYELTNTQWRKNNSTYFTGMTRSNIGSFFHRMSYDHVGFRLGITLDH